MRRMILPVLLLTAAFALLAPASALAADAREYQLQLSPVTDSGSSQMIVTAVLDPEASLPATVSVPVPAGAQLLWSGELLGGPAADDPFREATVERVGSMDVYTFTIERSYVGQVEVALGPPSLSGTQVTSSLEWTNPGPEVLVSCSVVVEPGAKRVKITPEPTGDVQTNELGEALYPLGAQRVAQGGTYVVEVSWRRGAGGFPVLPVVGGALALAVAGLVLLLARERTRARRAAARRASRD